MPRREQRPGERERQREKRMLEMRFAYIETREFEEMALSTGFRIDALYGDYQYGAFSAESSPFRIWVLSMAN